MSDQSPPTGRRWLGRVFDLLAIATVALAILWVAWMSTRGQSVQTSPPMPILPELELQFPMAGEGMLLSKERVSGDRQQALAQLQQLCLKVLKQPVVLSLEVGTEERRLLAYCTPDSRVQHTISGSPLPLGEELGVRELAQPGPTIARPLDSSSDPLATIHALYRLPQDEGLIAVREFVSSSSTPAVASPHLQALSQWERGAAGQAAANEPRVVCWGVVVSDSAGGNSIWFARPALSLPTASKAGSLP